jgi:hypothetical protein
VLFVVAIAPERLELMRPDSERGQGTVITCAA